MSKTKCVVPAATFLAMTEIIILSNDSKDRGSSTRIMISSAGAIPSLPFQSIQPPTSLTIFSICLGVNSTEAIASITSAVPAGVVIARDEILGILNPAAAIIGTIIIVVLVPAMPPTECLSATIPLNLSLLPVSTIALVKKNSSCEV